MIKTVRGVKIKKCRHDWKWSSTIETTVYNEEMEVEDSVMSDIYQCRKCGMIKDIKRVF